MGIIILKAIFELFIIIVALFLLYVLVLWGSIWFVDRNKDYMKDSRFYRMLLNIGGILAIHGTRLKIHTEGLEKIPKDSRFLLVCNHRSKYDPIVTWYVLRKYNLAFISKIENFKVFLYGKVVRRTCSLPIDRVNRGNALETVKKAALLIQDDEVSVGVYPEGTRSKDRNLLPFHNAVFKIAKFAGCPIVVISITGTEQIHINYPRKHTDIYFKVIETVSKDEVEAMNTAQIGNRVYADIINNLEEDIKNEQEIRVV